MSVDRPILRYHGGKWKLAPWIIANMPEHRVYVEPFGGGGSVLLRKPRCFAEVYNDLDDAIVNLFRIMRDSSAAARLCELLELTPYARTEFLDAWESSSDPFESARRLVIRSFMGLGSAATTKDRAPASKSRGGLARTGFRIWPHGSGGYPVDGWVRLPDQYAQLTERLRGVMVENLPASKVIVQHDSTETLHYVDPPYVAATRDAGGDYRFEMTDADHVELAALLHSVSGMVILSGYASELYRDLYGDWDCLQRATMADGAQPRTEVLWFNLAAWKRRPQTSLLEACA